MLTRKQARDQRLKPDGSRSTNSNSGSKRPAESSPGMPQPNQKKRSVLGDITNDLRNVRIDSSKKQLTTVKADKPAFSLSLNDVKKEEDAALLADVAPKSGSASDVSMLSTVEESKEEMLDELASPDLLTDVQAAVVPGALPPGFGIRTDYDRENELDPYNVPHYAQDIFDYYKAREARFLIGDYIDRQQSAGGISRQMRAILVDWMVEVQESFELNHETLYQAVKMVDLYLEKTVVDKETLQLIGATALFISSKFDERQPPVIDDFLYICDDAYTRKEVLDTEEVLLKTLQFDIGFPLSYRYLRRYAKATKADMTTLTLARFILEMSLMHYEFVRLPESLMAAAAFLLALRMKDNADWTDLHTQYTGYTVKELLTVMWDMNTVIKGTPLTKTLKNIRAKYSHDIFFGVAKIPPLLGSPSAAKCD